MSTYGLPRMRPTTAVCDGVGMDGGGAGGGGVASWKG